MGRHLLVWTLAVLLVHAVAQSGTIPAPLSQTLKEPVPATPAPKEKSEDADTSAIKFTESKAASEIGIILLGFLGGANKRRSVALVKDIAANKTKPVMPGNSLILKNKNYLVLAVSEKFLILNDNGASIAVYKEGFPLQVPHGQSSASLLVASSGLTDSFREDGFERDKGAIKLTDSYRKKMMTDLPSILMQASAEPVIDKEGNIVGFLMDQIEPNSIYEKAGLRNGDIVKSINGTDLDDIQATIKLLNSIKNVAAVDFVFSRNGQDVPVSVNVQ